MERLLKPERFEGTQDTTPAQWNHWFCTFNNFVQSISPSPDKLKLLVNYISPEAYAHITECSSFEEAIKALKTVYVKPKNIIFARHQLATRRQQQSESIDTFLLSLKQLSKDCDYKEVTADTYTQEAIRDAFITGLASPTIRQRLLERESLSLNEAVQLARSLDTAQRNAEGYSSPVTPGNVSAAPALTSEASINTTDTVAVASQSQACFFCGGKRHPRYRCPARVSVCRKCGKTGHYASVCRSGDPGRSRRPHTAAAATMEPPVSTSLAPPSVHCTLPPTTAATPVLASVTTPRSSTIPVSVNELLVNSLIDSGSTISFIHPQVVKDLNISVYPSKTDVTLASSQVSTTGGHCFVDLKVNDSLYPQFKLSVLPQLCYKVILGRDFMEKHQAVEFSLDGYLPKLTICNVASMSIDPPSLFPNLSPNTKPVSTCSRKFSRSDEEFIHEEVQSLLHEGIVEKSQSPWRAQVLVTSDERHKRRMVVDYSRTINRFTSLDAYPMPRIYDLIHKMAKYKIFSKLDLKSAYYQVPLRETEKQYTAFEADGQLLQFTRVPFGLSNSVAVFQRIMDSIIADNKLQATYAYIDDVIVCGVSKEDHDQNLQRFKEVASKYNLTLNLEKCHYGLREITYLGYCISDSSLRPDPDRIRPLIDMPVPNDLPSLKRALGLFSYYSIWIPNYSKRIQPLLMCQSLPLGPEAIKCFESLKRDICKASVAAFDETLPLQIETDASSVSIAATLSQLGRPVAFFSRTLTGSERLQPAVEREATAIIEAVRKWRLFILGRKFTIVTDQQAVSFMFDSRHSSKIKNDKILRWRLELSEYLYDIKYRPGPQNIPCDTLSRACSVNTNPGSVSLEQVHVSLCHPGVTRLYHFVKVKNLAFSLDDVRRVCSQCSICSELKPRFFKPPDKNLIHATQPFDRISIDFTGPKPSTTKNKYLLVMIDEYSRFPFVFPCPDMSAQTVKACFLKLFSMFGCPSSVHSDRGTQFMSREVADFLLSHGVVMTHSTPYHPQGNGQCEREIGTIWKAVRLALKSFKLPESQWELVLDRVLHSIRSLLCTATNQTPHERLFSFPRKSFSGYSLPSWLATPGPVLLRKFIRNSKSDPLVEEVDLERATPNYAHIRHPDGRRSTVSTRDLAPTPKKQTTMQENFNETRRTEKTSGPEPVSTEDGDGRTATPDACYPASDDTRLPDTRKSESPETSEARPEPLRKNFNETTRTEETSEARPEPLRRSTRVRKAPDRLGV